jgi:hypothetical protein
MRRIRRDVMPFNAIHLGERVAATHRRRSQAARRVALLALLCVQACHLGVQPPSRAEAAAAIFDAVEAWRPAACLGVQSGRFDALAAAGLFTVSTSPIWQDRDYSLTRAGREAMTVIADSPWGEYQCFRYGTTGISLSELGVLVAEDGPPRVEAKFELWAEPDPGGWHEHPAVRAELGRLLRDPTDRRSGSAWLTRSDGRWSVDRDRSLRIGSALSPRPHTVR